MIPALHVAASLASSPAAPPVPRMPPVVFPVGEPHPTPPRAIELPVFIAARSWNAPSRSRESGRAARRSAALYVASMLISMLAIVAAGWYFFHHLPLDLGATEKRSRASAP
jgi:hypothetical protein